MVIAEKRKESKRNTTRKNITTGVPPSEEKNKRIEFNHLHCRQEKKGRLREKEFRRTRSDRRRNAPGKEGGLINSTGCLPSVKRWRGGAKRTASHMKI